MPEQVVGGIVQPNVDLIGPMKSLADLQMAQSHAALFTAQARQANARQNALATASALRAKGDETGALNAIAAVDPELAKQMQSFGQDLKKNSAVDERSTALRRENPGMKASDRAITGQPDIQQTVAGTENTKSTTVKTNFETHIAQTGELANRAVALFEQKDAGKITDQQLTTEWNKIIFDAAQKGLVNPLELNNLINSPDRAYAERAQKMVLSSKDYLEQTGAPAGNKAAAELPAKTAEARNNAALELWKSQNQPRDVGADSSVMVPNASPMPAPVGVGGPLNIGYGPAQGTVQPPAPTTAPPTGAPAAPLQPPAAGAVTPPPIPGGPAIMTAPATAPAGGPTTPPPPVANTVPSKFGDIPVLPNLNGPAAPGTIKQGTPKHITEEIQRAGEEAGKIRTSGNDAALNIDTLARLESTLQNVPTSKILPYQKNIAASIYAITGGDLALAKKYSGVDLVSADLAEKEMTRLGLTFARQTEGAREAVQAIKIALGANPQITTAKDSNIKIAGVLREIAQWQADKAEGIGAYGMAQAEKGQNGLHYVNFNQWWNQNHPVTEYTSKIVPLQYPKGGKDLYPNTTYTGETKDAEGNIVVKTGKFIGRDASGKPQFAPVE